MSRQCFHLSLSACFTTPLHQGSRYLYDDLDIFSFSSPFLHVCIYVCLFLCVHINFVLHACLYPCSYQTQQRKSVSKEVKFRIEYNALCVSDKGSYPNIFIYFTSRLFFSSIFTVLSLSFCCKCKISSCFMPFKI